MGNISLHTHIDSGMTCVPNDFIDSYLPRANGEYVKLYLYLLRTVSFEKEVSLEAVAEDLEYTEKDIRRALSYWEKEGLLYLDFDADGSLSGICFDGFGKKADAPVHAAEAAATQESPKKAILSADRIAALSAQKDIEELLFIAAQYIGKPLSPSEISNILYFYDELHFSKDLIEYLIEYCVSKGSKSRHYMEKVAFEWAKEGIHTVHEAKQSTNLYNRNYYKILNAFGIKGRGPAKPETEYMDCWLNTYHFTLEIILEACARTIAQTQRPNFQYADKILSEWHKSNVHHLSDIKALDAAHLKKQKAEKPKTAPANKFNNFHQRDYDFEQLEKQLLNT
nr:DnaD domain protein [Hominisplanchenecus murintestinalis]